MKKKSITELVDTEYKDFFNHVSKSKGTFFPCEGLLACERKIMYAAYMMNIETTDRVLTRKLASDTGLYHISGEASVQDTIKIMGSTYKRQHETCLLKGIGAFPTSLSNTGAAARYTHICATPLARKIFEDMPYFQYFVDDSGIRQPKYIVMPMPYILLCTYKQMGIGKACYIQERPHDEVFEWSRKIVDCAFPGKSGGYAETWYNDVKNSGITNVDYLNTFVGTAKFKDINDSKIKELKSITPPDPFMHTGCVVKYFPDDDKTVRMESRFEIDNSGRTNKYYVTDLPIEISDTSVMAKISKKYGKEIMPKVINHSGDGNQIKLEIPKGIYNDTNGYMAIGLVKENKENYVIFDEELGAPRIINDLWPIVISWYKEREKVVAKKLYHNIFLLNRKIYRNNLIREYYNEVVLTNKKIKSKSEVISRWGEEDGKWLYSNTADTYLPDNVKELDNIDKNTQDKIKNLENDILNIKDYIFNEWREVADKNKEFLINQI